MPLTGMHILLAEDNPTNQLVAQQMLESLGARVTLAEDGVQALECLQVDRFDVALIDIEMPRLSGIELMRKLRADEGPLAQMPLIALTAYVMREHRIAIEEAGADGIIAKPILSIEKFGEEIAHHMKARRAEPAVEDDPAPGAVLADTAPEGFDLAIYNTLCASFDANGRAELLGRIVSDLEAARSKVAAALEVVALADLRAATHVLISVCGVIGAMRAQSLAQVMNDAGHRADIDMIRAEGPKLLVELRTVLDYVRSTMGR